MNLLCDKPRPLVVMFWRVKFVFVVFVDGHFVTISAKLFLIPTIGFREDVHHSLYGHRALCGHV